MFRVAICEDMLSEREHLIEKIDAFFRRRNLRYSVDAFSSGETILAEFQDGAAVFDLVFMDIHLGDENGFETAKRIREINREVSIAFLTKSREYAVESYDVEAAGYFLKPIDEKKLFRFLEKMTKTEMPKCLSVKQRGRMKNLDFRDILYMESSGHRVTIHLVDGREECVYYKLDDLEHKLDDNRFIRCHKSYLVNMDFVRAAEKDFQIQTGAVVPIRCHGRKDIIKAYMTYFSQKHLDEEK